jgi:hypothetical protein
MEDVMAQYDLFKDPVGHIKAVKHGWSWPAFLFTAIWALVKGMSVRFVLLFVVEVLLLALAQISGFLAMISWTIDLGISVYFGMYGNEMYLHFIERRGYQFANRVVASSPGKAVSAFSPPENT